MDVIGIPEGEDTEGNTDTIFEERMAKMVQNLMKIMNLQIQESQWAPSTHTHTKNPQRKLYWATS